MAASGVQAGLGAASAAFSYAARWVPKIGAKPPVPELTNKLGIYIHNSMWPGGSPISALISDIFAQNKAVGIGNYVASWITTVERNTTDWDLPSLSHLALIVNVCAQRMFESKDSCDFDESKKQFVSRMLRVARSLQASDDLCLKRVAKALAKEAHIVALSVVSLKKAVELKPYFSPKELPVLPGLNAAPFFADPEGEREIEFQVRYSRRAVTEELMSLCSDLSSGFLYSFPNDIGKYIGDALKPDHSITQLLQSILVHKNADEISSYVVQWIKSVHKKPNSSMQREPGSSDISSWNILAIRYLLMISQVASLRISELKNESLDKSKVVFIKKMLETVRRCVETSGEWSRAKLLFEVAIALALSVQDKSFYPDLVTAFSSKRLPHFKDLNVGLFLLSEMEKPDDFLELLCNIAYKKSFDSPVEFKEGSAEQLIEEITLKLESFAQDSQEDKLFEAWVRVLKEDGVKDASSVGTKRSLFRGLNIEPLTKILSDAEPLPNTRQTVKMIYELLKGPAEQIK